MLEKTRGIVLRSYKYSETSLITRIFTERFGQLSFLVPGIRKSKSGKGNLLQPGQLLEIDCYFRENRNFQRFREFKVDYIPENIHRDIRKFSILTFLIELAGQLAHEKEENEALFRYLYRIIVELDGVDVHGLYPIEQLLAICGIMGFQPSDDYDPENKYFNQVEGCFQTSLHHMEEVLGEYDSLLMHRLLDGERSFKPADRRRMLDILITYFQLHVPGFRGMKSIDVLHEVLS